MSWTPQLGDRVRVRRLVQRVGYEKTKNDIRREVIEEWFDARFDAPDDLDVFREDYPKNPDNKDAVRKEVWRRIRALSGAKRKVIFLDWPFNPDHIYTVIGRRTRKTGIYEAPGGGYDYWGEYDYDPGGLRDAKTIFIYQVRLKIHDIFPLFALAKDMEVVSCSNSETTFT